MRFYIIYRHHWPDSSPYGSILQTLAEHFVAEGHEVTVFAGQPCYNGVPCASRSARETVAGVKIVRMPLLRQNKTLVLSRIVNTGLFLAGAIVFALTLRKIDVTMAVTSPPVFLGAVARWISRLRRSRFLYHIQDLHPEAGLTCGVLREGAISRMMARIDDQNVREADLAVVLSREMKEAVRARGQNGCNVRVLNNFSIESSRLPTPLPESLKRKPDSFRVLFAGNHGEFQGLQQLISAAHLLGGYNGIQFLFIGNGVVKPQLIERAADLVGRTVFFHDFVPRGFAFRVMQESQLGIVPLAPGMYRYAFPSKAATLLMAGCPILAVVECDSSLARLVQSRMLGWVSPPGCVREIAESILCAYASRRKWENERDRIRRTAERHFGTAAKLEAWSRLVRRLE